MDIFRKSAFLSALALWVAMSTEAQENRFLYLQTDDGQPFYVKAGGVHHSSTLSGFLILSRLQDTAIDFVLGFPRDMYPAQRFLVSPVDRDRGLVLKRQEDGKWVLFDLQTMEATAGEEVMKQVPVSRQALPQATADSFTTILSTAIGDSSLLETRVTGVRNEETKAAVQPSPSAIADSSNATQAKNASSGVSDVSRAGVKPPSEASSTGLSVTQAAYADSVKARTEARAEATADSVAAAFRRPMPVVDSSKNPDPNPTPVVSRPSSERSTADSSKGILRADRTDCKGSQTVRQLADLRRRMESVRDEEAKVAEAVRELRVRCFTTEQVRSLLVVFEREEGRFKLLSAAYPYVQDPSAYPGLLPILKDPYFIHRFKRLTGLPVD